MIRVASGDANRTVREGVGSRLDGLPPGITDTTVRAASGPRVGRLPRSRAGAGAGA